MKHRIIILSFVLCLLTIGCCFDGNNMENVAYRYSKAMANYDVDKAWDYATDETRNTTLVKAKFYTTKIDPKYIESDTPAKIEILETMIIDDTSGYAIYHKTTPIKDFSDTLHMRRRNGKWYAHAPLQVIKLSHSADTTQAILSNLK